MTDVSRRRHDTMEERMLRCYLVKGHKKDRQHERPRREGRRQRRGSKAQGSKDRAREDDEGGEYMELREQEDGSHGEVDYRENEGDGDEDDALVKERKVQLGGGGRYEASDVRAKLVRIEPPPGPPQHTLP